MAYTFSALKQELADRGFTYLSDTRRGNFINQGYQELCEAGTWPFLEVTATPSVPPITITDLRAVLSVSDNTGNFPSRLRYANRGNLERLFGDLTATGAPEFWYFDGSVIKEYPVGTANVTVRYLKSPANLSAAGDLPVIPDRWQYLIVDGAVIRAYQDNDEFFAAQAVQSQYTGSLQLMQQNLLVRNYDSQDWVYSDPHYLIG